MPCVARFAFPVEAQFFQTLLVSEGIEAEVHGLEAATTLSGGNLMHSAEVWVAEEDLPKAVELHREFMASQIQRAESAQRREPSDESLPELFFFRIAAMACAWLLFGFHVAVRGFWRSEGSVFLLSMTFATSFLMLGIYFAASPVIAGLVGWWTLNAIVIAHGGVRFPNHYLVLETCLFASGMTTISRHCRGPNRKRFKAFASAHLAEEDGSISVDKEKQGDEAE